MTERSHLTNGRFLQNLDGWTLAGGAVYSAGDGDDHYGVANLPAGASISQTFSVPAARRYSLHLSVKTAAATIQLTDGNGNALPSLSASGSAGSWTETTHTIGLAPGATYTLTISNAGVSTIRIDDVWLWYVPKTRAELAAIVARKLATLASDAGLSTTSSGAQTEGSYTDAVDAGLRAVGALDDETDEIDIRALTSSLLDSCVQQIERAILEQLHAHYAVLVDTDEGPLRQKLSQIATAIKSLGSGSAAAAGGRAVVVRAMRRSAADYELNP